MTPDADGQGATVTLRGSGAARLVLTYQRQKASGVYEDVYNIAGGGQELVSVTLTL